ncbi:MAG: hypothetical protein MJH11_00015 [Lentisphaeria bacterium]|nr:hypothetical protein [Lentisphaeria bacterium]
MLWGQDIKEEATPYYDGYDSVTGNISKVDDVRVADRTPLFDNAPFLSLRSTGELVLGKKWCTGGKGASPGFSANHSFFLKSRGKFYYLSTHKKDKKLLLSSASDCLLFRWDVTIENGKKLIDIYNIRNEMSLAKYKEIGTALQKLNEKIKIPLNVNLKKAHVISESKLRYILFEGIAYNRYSNYIYKYSLKIGPYIFIHNQEKLIIGPKRIEHTEFEGYKGNGLMNDTEPFTVSPEIAKVKKAKYDKYMEFQKLVLKFLKE